MPQWEKTECPECADPGRRQFLRTVGGAALATTASVPLVHAASAAAAIRAQPGPPGAPAPESLVKTFHTSLSEEQRKSIAFPWEHPLRSKVDNNWAITPVKIRTLKPDQQQMCREIFRQLHSEEYYPKILRQLMDDAGGIDNYHVAMFGTPGSGKFEWVFTGRHKTIRCDGDSLEGAAFGGPIFYGHAARGFNEAPDHPGNVYWYQALRANEVYRALDGKQRSAALLGDGPAERGTATVELKAGRKLAGLPVSGLSRDQKELVGKVMGDLLAPFRKADAEEVMKHVQSAGGLDSLTLSYYKNEDIGMDGVWDVWKLEGPSMIWYFRGSPHVHTWVNVQAKPQS